MMDSASFSLVLILLTYLLEATICVCICCPRTPWQVLGAFADTRTSQGGRANQDICVLSAVLSLCVKSHLFVCHLGMGQNETTRETQILVLVSIGQPILGILPIFGATIRLIFEPPGAMLATAFPPKSKCAFTSVAESMSSIM